MHGLPLRRLAYSAIGFLLLVTGAQRSEAQGQGATLQKCTCRFDDNAPPASQGARAANATACTQMLDKGHRWCEITIACLRGNIGPQCGAKSAPKQALLPLLDFSVQQVANAGGLSAAVIVPAIDRAKPAIAAMTKNNEKTLDRCIDAYLLRSPEDVRQSANGLSCAFERSTGWLAIAYRIGTLLVQFSFGPRE